MRDKSSRTTRSAETIVKSLTTVEKREVIPTTFVPLSPDKILLGREIDILFGLFHIMWKDMPRPMTYKIRLAELITNDGEYIGVCLKYGIARTKSLKC